MGFAKTVFRDMTLSQLAAANFRLAAHGYDADACCNQLARAVVRRMRSENNGQCWLVNIMSRTIKPYTRGMVRNFACDFVLPKYDAAVADALADIKEHGLSAERLDKLYELIHNVNGECIFWK